MREKQGLHGKYIDGKWALVDAYEKPITENKYSFVHEFGEGYFIAEMGTRKNVLRQDGTEILSEWFNDIFNIANGFFIIGITKRKTKTTPTQYLRGVAHVSGTILFPPIFTSVKWLTEKKDAFYAKLNGKPYVLTTDGSIFDPERSHLPKRMGINIKSFIEKFVNWTLPGLQFFYRDTDAQIDIEKTYHEGDIIRAGFFIDVTQKLYKPNTKTRFLIASAHAAMLCDVKDIVENNPNIENWGLCLLHFNSYFKVMDVFTYEGVTQVFLLHIPTSAARIFGTNKVLMNLSIEATGQETNLVETARQSLIDKMKMDVHPRSLDRELIERTYHPVGLNNNFQPISLSIAEEPSDNEIAPLSNLVHRLAKDDDISGFLEVDDNFPWNGVDGHICNGCIYTRGIIGKGEGCGRLLKKSFRERYIKGRCEYRKEDLFEESAFERDRRIEIEKAVDLQEKQSDVFARRLLSQFIDEKLNGEIDNLIGYDFEQLRDDKKYGYCQGTAFSVDSTIIMKSIMALIFASAWPGLNVDALIRRKYEIDKIQYFIPLFGANIFNQYFKVLREFSQSKELHERCLNIVRLTNTIGNYFVIPCHIPLWGIRNKYKFRGYMDKFLIELYAGITKQRNVDQDVKLLLDKNKELTAYYQDGEPFTHLINSLILNDFVQNDGTPKVIFKGVYGSQKGLDTKTYLNAVDEFCTFTEDFIPRRSKLVVDKLKQILRQK